MEPAAASIAVKEDEELRTTEREHIRTLINADLEAARQIHADDFQLVTPLGVVFSKEEYLGAIAAGVLHYLTCEFDSPLEVRVYRDVGLVRYRSQIEIVVQGEKYPRARYWHTNAYEKRDGHWQLVWSQATGVA